MFKYNPAQAAQKLVEMVGNPEFALNHAKELVHNMVVFEYMSEIEFLDDAHLLLLVADAQGAGW